MDFKYLFLTVGVCFLVCVQVKASRTSNVSLKSFWRPKHCTNGGGNLLKISDQCVSSSGRQRCKAKCDGSLTTQKNTKFTMVNRGSNINTIQFTDNQDTSFALKVISVTNLVFEERKSGSTPSLFTEAGTGRTYTYMHKSMCLICDCNGNLSLSNKTASDRECFFYKLCRTKNVVLQC